MEATKYWGRGIVPRQLPDLWHRIPWKLLEFCKLSSKLKSSCWPSMTVECFCSFFRLIWGVFLHYLHGLAKMETRKISILFFISLFVTHTYAAVDTINATHPLIDGETLVSEGSNFQLGFFKPGSSNRTYVGIWYMKIPVCTFVWVANKEIPLVDSSGVLAIRHPGILVLINGTGHVIWSTNSSISTSLQNPVARLLDSGNLVVKEDNDENTDNIAWQSFDYPTDTQLPGMKVGWDLVTGFQRYLTSWSSSDDPSSGIYTYGIDRHGYPQPFIMRRSVLQFRFGPWDGINFGVRPWLLPNGPNIMLRYWFVFNQKELYYEYELVNSSVISHRVLTSDGTLERLVWNNQTQAWILYLSTQQDNCDTYELCGAFGVCNVDRSPECGCLQGFAPKSQKGWESRNWSDGCVRQTPLDCKNGDGFVKHSNVKLPNTMHSWYNTSMTLAECEKLCLQNCSCLAYSNIDVRAEGSGCLIWFGDLIDIRVYDNLGVDLYVRVASSEIGKLGSVGKKHNPIIVMCTILPVVLLTIAITLYFRKKQKNGGKMKLIWRAHSRAENRKQQEDLPLFNFKIIAEATENFSEDKKLGEGGFGPVYKGILKGGQEIAVKRLSKYSTQGLDEFKTEVKCIAKLQHRNLVKLLGCCIRFEERMLIYEYMPNKSLDYIIFDQERSRSLNWTKRFDIINGIARGLLYLHQDSRLRIVHRDLKAGNILLDHEFNAKISDFGMARSFGGNDCEAKTKRVVGTYGYMSPEYAIDGLFSLKSDVFSYGVLVLEIVSGKRNMRFSHPDHHHNLLGHAWKLYNEGESLKLIDPALFEQSNNIAQILRSIHIGQLCVQELPEDRPTMSSVVFMLGSDIELPPPKQPGFFISRILRKEDSTSSSINEFTITQLSSR
ncbi:hypothetical protein Ancab_039691 [Ancistrocladus abbreviatus]